MRLAYAFPATAAEFSQDGKVGVLGGDYDTIYAPQFPAVHPVLALVVKLQVEPLECGREHTLRVAFVNADGGAVHPELSFPFTTNVRPDQPHRPVGVGLVVNYQGLQFERPGNYAFHILVDNIEVGAVPLSVMTPPQPAQHGEAALRPPGA